MGITRCASECLSLPARGCEDAWGCSWANATNSTEEGSCAMAGDGAASSIWIGILLSLLGDVVINVGMNSMKHAHNTNTDADGLPVKHFTLVPWWWAGILGIVGGEVANIVAYGYAPASIVTPMGAIGVLTNVLITTFLLKEPFYRMQLVGIVLVVAGIVSVVVFAPSTAIKIESNTIWIDWMYTMEFLVYTCVLAFLLPVFLLLGRKYGETTVLIHLTSCALMSSITIVCAKCFSTLLKSGLERGFDQEWQSPTPYVALVIMVLTAVGSMGFVNKAMMIFGNSVVVPCYYALFTVVSVGSVAWVYREFDCLMDKLQIAMFLMGVGCTVLGVCLLQLGAKDRDGDGDEEKGYVEGSGFDNPKRSTMTAVWGSGFNGAALIYPLTPLKPSAFDDTFGNRRKSETVVTLHQRRMSLIGYMPSKPTKRHTTLDRSGSFFSSTTSSVFSRGVHKSIPPSLSSNVFSTSLSRSQSSRAASSAAPASLLGTHPPRARSLAASRGSERVRGAGVESPLDRMEEEGSESPVDDSRSPLLAESKARAGHDDKAVITVNLSACAPTGPPTPREHSAGDDTKFEPPTVLTHASASASGSAGPDAMFDAKAEPPTVLTSEEASACGTGDADAIAEPPLVASWPSSAEAGHEVVVDVGESTSTTLKSSVLSHGPSADGGRRGQPADAPAQPSIVTQLYSPAQTTSTTSPESAQSPPPASAPGASGALGSTGRSVPRAASFCSRKSSVASERSVPPPPPSQVHGNQGGWLPVPVRRHDTEDAESSGWSSDD